MAHAHLVARLWIAERLADVATLSGHAAVDHVPPGPWADGNVYIVMTEQSSGLDTTALGGARVQSQPLYLVRAITQGESLMALTTWASAIDSALHNQAGAVSGGRVLLCTREQPFSLVEQDKQSYYAHLGGLYRLQVQEV